MVVRLGLKNLLLIINKKESEEIHVLWNKIPAKMLLLSLENQFSGDAVRDMRKCFRYSSWTKRKKYNEI